MTRVYEYFNGVLCVLAEVLYGELNLISYDAYKKKCIRGTIKNERTGRPGYKALVNYDLLPEAWKALIVQRYGDPRKLIKNQSFTDFITRDISAEVYFRDYRYNENSSLPLPKQKEYCTNAELLNTIRLLQSNLKARRKAIAMPAATGLWDNIGDILNNLDREKYPHSLPSNTRSIQRVMQQYRKAGYQSLIHKGFGNSNSEKINPDAQMWVLARWSDQVRKVANLQQLFLEYNAVAPDKGWKTLADPTSLHLFLYSEDVQGIWFAHRRGELKAKEKFNYQQSTKLPSMRDSLWYSDGTKLNYFYMTEDGKVATCTVYEVMDAYSEVLVGYCISDSEDYATQYSAYKMAVQFAGHRPYQLGFDNQGGHKKLIAGSFLSKVAHLAIKTEPYNGKSKTIESAFGRFQAQYLKRDWFFTGQNIQAKREESKANLEFINANKSNLPSLNEIKRIYKERREEWNNAPHHATGLPRIAMYQGSVNDACPVVELWDMIEIFWVLREQPVMYNAYGLTFTEKKQKHTYTVYKDGLPDVEWHGRNIDKKFWIKFDPEDMSTVMLYEKDSQDNLRFVTEASMKVEIARGKQEQTSHDHQFIADIKKANNALRLNRVNAMEDILKEHGRSAEQYGLNVPPVLGVNSSKKKKRSKKAATDFGEILKAETELVDIPTEKPIDEDFNIFDRI